MKRLLLLGCILALFACKDTDRTYNTTSVVRYDVGTCPDCGPDARPVPEPATMVLLGTGLVALAWRARKK